MDSLPIEILETIFSWLPSLSTVQCRRVCKTWKTVIGKSKVDLLFQFGGKLQNLCYTDRFSHEVNLDKYDSGETLTNHLDTSKDIQALVFNQQIVGSCNGLVCFLSQHTEVDHYDNFIICNPITDEYVILQRVDREIVVKWKDLKFGFGYLHSTYEYMVVRIDCNMKTIHVFSLGSGVCWRIIKDEILYIFEGLSIFANGDIHWLESIKVWKNKIVAFDLADEKFKSVPSPTWEYYYAVRDLVLLGGNLCVVSYYTRGYQGSLDIWAFKKAVNGIKVLFPTVAVGHEYYNNMWSWNKEFSIPHESTEWYKPLEITESKEFLLWITNYSSDKSEPICIYCYDPNNSTLHKSSSAYYHNTCGSFPRVFRHMNTLLSLKKIGE